MGSTSYDYDLNGNVTRTLLENVLNGSGWRYTWNAVNRNTTYATLESYTYDADGERALRTANGQTTVTMGGLWEETLGSQWRALYTFNGELIGATTNAPGNFVYLLGDHLGSMSWSRDLSGNFVGGAEYGPYGEVRAASGTLLSESHNFTGQLLDSTGLLYYHARYYDPALGRFLAPDSVVPGSGALTLAPHDATAAGLWKQPGGGPANPQDLNRYAYALNNPVRNIDPTGHCVPGIGSCRPIWQTGGGLNWRDGAAFASGVAKGAVNAVVSVVTAPLAVVQAVSDPAGTVAGIQAQAATVARGAAFLASNPAGAAAALNDDPHGVGVVLGTAAGSAGMATGAKALASARGGSDTLYRAVSEAEFQDLNSTGGFRSHPRGLSAEGKYFAERAEHAAAWGNAMFGSTGYRVVAGRVSSRVPYQRWDKLDGIGPARFYEGSDLSKISYKGAVK